MNRTQTTKPYSRDTQDMKYYNFYTKYLNLTSDLSENATQNLQAPSPFGDGVLTISPDGIFSCSVTGKSGNPVDFIKEIYSSVTEQGAKLIAKEDNRLQHRQLCQAYDLIEAFRQDEELLKIAAFKQGLSPKEMKQMPIFMDKRGFKYYCVTNRSCNGTPLAIATYSSDRPLRNALGIIRPPEINSKRVWLTENPVIANLIEDYFGDTAFCWPKQRELEIFNYKEMFEGKEVIALHGELTYTYDESFYPFFEMIRRTAGSFADVRYEALCQGEHFAKWIAEKANQELLLMQAQVSTNLQPITKAHYEKYIRMDDTIDVQYGQASARGYFFYGTGEDAIAQSYPLSLDSVQQTEANYRLRFIRPTRFHDNIKLNPDRVISIGQSITQFTPRNTFDMTRGLISDHIYFEHKEMETLLSLWIMGTYVFSLFNAYPYLHINAAKGSGKTTLLELIEKCSFNGIMASRITPANLIQTISDTQCTLCLDEFEKNTGGQGDSHTQILNAGYKKGGSYRRQRGSNTDSMNLYSPKVYASIDPIKAGALASRTLRIEMTRKPKHTPIQGWDAKEGRTQKRINEIMSGGYATGLYHHDMIEYLLARQPRQITLPCGIAVDGRERELIAPLVIMAQLVDINNEGGEVSVESELYQALESILFPDKEEELQRIKILTNQLREWGENPDQLVFTIKGEICWISNKMWDSTRLMTHFEGNRNELLNWLKSLNDGVLREATHIAGHGTESCTGFPLDLTLNSKEFRDWISPDSSSKAA